MAIETMALGDVLTGFAEGLLLVPNLPAGPPWCPEQVISLLDSVTSGYPIGGLLVSGDLNRGKLTRLLDGRNRVTILAACLAGAGVPGSEPRDDATDIYWALGETQGTQVRRWTDEGPVPATYFPLRALFRTMDFLRATQPLENDLELRHLREEAQQLANTVIRTRVPITRLIEATAEQTAAITSRISGITVTTEQVRRELNLV